MRALMAERPVDLVVLDINIPGEDGLPIARLLRAGSDWDRHADRQRRSAQPADDPHRPCSGIYEGYMFVPGAPRH